MWVRGLKQESNDSDFASQVVAPHVGAWIETLFAHMDEMSKRQSHPMWVRGLKLKLLYVRSMTNRSHPMWVRGLKLGGIFGMSGQRSSHPMWVRGLKLFIQMCL